MPSVSHHAPSRRRCAATLALGALLGGAHTLAFAPTQHGGWLQFPVFAALFWLIAQARTRPGAAALGLAFGFGNFVTGAYWLYISMHDYGGMPPPLAGGAVVLFSLYLACYPALACGAWRATETPRRVPFAFARVDAGGASRDAPPATAGSAGPAGALLSAAVFGATWALGEWLRETVFTGFPWLSSGYAQVDGPLAGLAPFVGVMGVGFATASAGALLAQCLFALRHRRGQPVRMALVPGACLLALLGLGLLGATVRFATPRQAPLTVRLLQGNVAQDMKFEQSELDRSIALYQRLITEKPADLIVTPETALPILIGNTPAEFAQTVRAFADRTGSAILLGAAGVIAPPRAAGTPAGAAAPPVGYTNSIFGLSPGRGELYRYDKHHLVPFGEFVPWGFRWFVDLMHIPLGDFARGPLVQPSFAIKGERVAIDICYEDIFGDEIARRLRRAADPASILVNSTNLGWFGNTVALDQHLQMARMRALETQRPVVRATNTGATAAIDAYGRVTDRLPSFTTGALDATVQGTVGLTPYVRFGDLPVLLLALLLLGAARIGRRSARRPPR
ncbi:apolipoprotein N-acyltransferase [Robbsia sp. Bb-Pol-6]|uniref:Apolipoprotein N-acyltransferase n=1 Tax=Robbsia betulipollinis TaxID=2981849 RepID=A0ABT3ZM28_9BURK|nr:apolipoprotein N-acyltransferase [Robbsia betulipollinis]MCY0387377.1 apolipoprotein N-acyltransferase [Robbsia betulipollinis]